MSYYRLFRIKTFCRKIDSLGIVCCSGIRVAVERFLVDFARRIRAEKRATARYNAISFDDHANIPELRATATYCFNQSQLSPLLDLIGPLPQGRRLFGPTVLESRQPSWPSRFFLKVTEQRAKSDPGSLVTPPRFQALDFLFRMKRRERNFGSLARCSAPRTRGWTEKQY